LLVDVPLTTSEAGFPEIRPVPDDPAATLLTVTGRGGLKK
jgi:hypothetical protein